MSRLIIIIIASALISCNSNVNNSKGNTTICDTVREYIVDTVYMPTKDTTFRDTRTITIIKRPGYLEQFAAICTTIILIMMLCFVASGLIYILRVIVLDIIRCNRKTNN